MLFDELGQKRDTSRRYTSSVAQPDTANVSVTKTVDLHLDDDSVSVSKEKLTVPVETSAETELASGAHKEVSISDSLQFPDDNFSLEVTRLKFTDDENGVEFYEGMKLPEPHVVNEESHGDSENVLSLNKELQKEDNVKEVLGISSKTGGIAQAGDKNFLKEFYGNSRLHHISMWGAQFKQLVKKLHHSSPSNVINWNDVSTDMVTNAMGLLNHRCKPVCWLPESRDVDPTDEFPEKVLAHIDLDCFFVSVGLLKHPELRGLPVAVTHSKGRGPRENPADSNVEQQDGISGANNILKSYAEIASCSYEARAKGVKNGMLMKNAIKLCPDLKTIQYDFNDYHRIAVTLYNTVARYSTAIQAVSCDECFVDITDCVRNSKGLSPCHVSSLIAAEVFHETGCHASVGISSNMLLARLSTKSAKPNGVFSLDSNRKDQLYRYLDSLPVDELPGVGFSSHQQLKGLGIVNVGDLRIRDLDELRSILGSKTGETLFNFSRGIDSRELNSVVKRKSVSAEINYGIRLTTQPQVESFIEELVEEVHRRLCECEMLTKSVCLKLRIRAQDQPKETKKFLGCGICDTVNKSKNFLSSTNNLSVIKREVAHILKNVKFDASDLRGVGVTLNKLTDEHDDKSPSKNQDIAQMFSITRNARERINRVPKRLVFASTSNETTGGLKIEKERVTEKVSTSKTSGSKQTESLWDKAAHKGHLYGEMNDPNIETVTLRDDIDGSDSDESVIDIQARDNPQPEVTRPKSRDQPSGRSKSDLNSKLMKFQKLRNKTEKLLKQQSAHYTSDAAKLAPAQRRSGFDIQDEPAMNLDAEQCELCVDFEDEYPKFGSACNLDDACKILQQWLKTPDARKLYFCIQVLYAFDNRPFIFGLDWHGPKFFDAKLL